MLSLGSQYSGKEGGREQDEAGREEGRRKRDGRRGEKVGGRMREEVWSKKEAGQEVWSRQEAGLSVLEEEVGRLRDENRKLIEELQQAQHSATRSDSAWSSVFLFSIF